MTVFYLLCVIVSFLNFTFFLVRMGTRYNVYFTFCYIFILISNLGFLAANLSVNAYEYIIATKILYLGGAFVPMLILFILSETYNVEIPRKLKFVLWTISFLVYLTILSIGFVSIYYKTVSLEIVNGVQVVSKEYGPMHFLFFLIFYFYLAGIIGVTIYALFKKKKVPAKLMFFLTSMMVFGCILFLSLHKFNNELDVLPLIYVLLEFVLVYLESQVCLNNIQNMLAKQGIQDSNVGNIVFDKKGQYCGINQIALDYFPEFNRAKIGVRLDNSTESFVALNRALYSSSEDDFSRVVQIEPNYFRFRIRKVYRRRIFIGFYVEVYDDTGRHQYTQLLKNYNDKLTEDVKLQTVHIEQMQQKIILGMADVVENRDNNTGGHIKRTSDTIAIVINSYKKLNQTGHTAQFFQDIIKAAPLHDLGKIAIEDKILRKPGKYTDEEFAIMKMHPGKSAMIVETIFKDVVEEHFYVVAKNVAHYHHEKWNGKGYPMGLSGENIPLEARFMAIVDVYDALVSKRCYKEAMTHEEAYKIIVESMGSHFDPGLLETFKHAYPSLVEYYSRADNS